MELIPLTRKDKLEYLIEFYENDIPKQIALLNIYKEELKKINEEESKTLKMERRK